MKRISILILTVFFLSGLVSSDDYSAALIYGHRFYLPDICDFNFLVYGTGPFEYEKVSDHECINPRFQITKRSDSFISLDFTFSENSDTQYLCDNYDHYKGNKYYGISWQDIQNDIPIDFLYIFSEYSGFYGDRACGSIGMEIITMDEIVTPNLYLTEVRGPEGEENTFFIQENDNNYFNPRYLPVDVRTFELFTDLITEPLNIMDYQYLLFRRIGDGSTGDFQNIRRQTGGPEGSEYINYIVFPSHAAVTEYRIDLLDGLQNYTSSNTVKFIPDSVAPVLIAVDIDYSGITSSLYETTISLEIYDRSNYLGVDGIGAIAPVLRIPTTSDNPDVDSKDNDSGETDTPDNYVDITSVFDGNTAELTFTNERGFQFENTQLVVADRLDNVKTISFDSLLKSVVQQCQFYSFDIGVNSKSSYPYFLNYEILMGKNFPDEETGIERINLVIDSDTEEKRKIEIFNVSKYRSDSSQYDLVGNWEGISPPVYKLFGFIDSSSCSSLIENLDTRVPLQIDLEVTLADGYEESAQEPLSITKPNIPLSYENNPISIGIYKDSDPDPIHTIDSSNLADSFTLYTNSELEIKIDHANSFNELENQYYDINNDRITLEYLNTSGSAITIDNNINPDEIKNN